MSRTGDSNRQRARTIRDEALAAVSERNRVSLALLLDEMAELKAMVADQQRQLQTLTDLLVGPTAVSLPSSVPRPLTSAKRQALERIRELRARNLSFAAICEIFQAEAIPTLSGEGQWSKGTLWNLWKNHAHQLDAPAD